MSAKKLFKKAYAEVRRVYGYVRTVREEDADWKAINAVGTAAIDAFFLRYRPDEIGVIRTKCYWVWHSDPKREWNGGAE